jgi:O-antigen/teichoic acid export membrane protein
VFGSLWIVIGRGLNNFSVFLIFALLARFLGPAEFGLVAFASVFVEIGQSLANAGMTQALVQRDTWDERTASTAFWTNMAFAGVLSGLVAFGVAPLVGLAFDPRLEPLVAALALTYAINAARATHEAKLQREFRFRALATQSIAVTIVGGGVGVTLAVLGYGAWSLVISRIVSAVLQTIVCWSIVRWVPKAMFSREESKRLLAFGIYISGSGILGQLNSRVPELVIGWLIGPVGVGFYRVASRGMNVINDLVVTPMQATTLATMSRLSDPHSVGKAYIRLIRACGVLSIPLYFGVAAIADDFVVVVFGQAWHNSGLIMSGLATAGAAATFGYFSQPTLAAVGRADLAMVTALGTLVGNFLAALVAVPFGLAFVGFAVSLRIYLTTPLGLNLIARVTGIKVADMLKCIAPQTAAALTMMLLLILARNFLLESLDPILRLCIMVPMGAVIYCAGMLLVGRSVLSTVFGEARPFITALHNRMRRA